MQKDILDLRELTNVEILNGIRNDASMEYQNRVPLADQSNIMQVVQNLMNYHPSMNEFLNQFVNRIGAVYARTQSWTNPLAMFKKGLVGMGDTVEEYMSDLLEAHGYDPQRDYGEKVLLGQERPAVQVNYHKVNRQDFYKFTINQAMLKRAFINDGGLASLISQLMEAPVKSDNFDEFLLMTKLFSLNDSMGGFFKVQVPNFSGLTVGATEARQALKQMRSLAYELPILSRKYNAAGLPMAINPEDLILIGTPDFLSSLDVDGLAQLFHLEKGESPWGRTIGLPEEYIGIDGAQGLLTSRDFFMVFDTLMENRSQPNPAGLYDNYFLHHHQIISLSRFVPAILFTSDSGTITIREDFTVSAVATPVVNGSEGAALSKVQRGSIYEVTADVTTVPAGADVAVGWSITGNLSPLTYIDRAGNLYIGGNETSSEIKVYAATTVVDSANPQLDGITASKTLTVEGDITIQWPGIGRIAGIIVNGVEVADVAASETSYTVAIAANAKVTKDTVSVLTIGAPDVTKAVAKIPAGGYTVTITVDPGVGAAVVYTVTVTQ